MITVVSKTRIPPGELTGLQRTLTSWRTLNQFFQQEGITLETLDKLMAVERETSNRPGILRRLAARYGKISASQLKGELDV